ncbi:MAG: hypothetical protein GX589_07670 [Deltaproteobacteria bacterium]|nr:hypothetical protein [Deltaproteobacteria bacterium]
MAIKVISGVVRGSESTSASTQSQNARQARNPVALASNVHVTNSAIYSDASVVCLRCSRAHAPSERIRESGQARDLARNIAERIEREEESLEVHGKLSVADSHHHLAES